MAATTERKGVNYKLRVDLIRRVKMVAARKECWPAHLVEAALDRYLDDVDPRTRRAARASA